MTAMALLIFAGIYALAVVTPGPGVAAIIARVMAGVAVAVAAR
jgi:hypothetical protein